MAPCPLVWSATNPSFLTSLGKSETGSAELLSSEIHLVLIGDAQT